MPLKEYKPGTTFPGIVGRTVDQSQPAWPEPLRAKEGAPNVLFIVPTIQASASSAATAAPSGLPTSMPLQRMA